MNSTRLPVTTSYCPPLGSRENQYFKIYSNIGLETMVRYRKTILDLQFLNLFEILWHYPIQIL